MRTKQISLFDVGDYVVFLDHAYKIYKVTKSYDHNGLNTHYKYNIRSKWNTNHTNVAEEFLTKYEN